MQFFKILNASAYPTIPVKPIKYQGFSVVSGDLETVSKYRIGSNQKIISIWQMSSILPLLLKPFLVFFNQFEAFHLDYGLLISNLVPRIT
jgi:hypothetical protein